MARILCRSHRVVQATVASRMVLLPSGKRYGMELCMLLNDVVSNKWGDVQSKHHALILVDFGLNRVLLVPATGISEACGTVVPL